MIVESTFKPAWWMTNQHIQTIIPRVYRRNHHIQTTDEILSTPDNDFLDISWTRKPSADEATPIVIVFHGLEGNVESFYASGMLAAIQQRGWIGVLMHFRGCSGRPNNAARAYHSGETQDPQFFIDYLSKQYPRAPLMAVGFSLGGNVLAKYLGEKGEQCKLLCGAVISAPLRLAGCAKRISQRFSKVYQKYLLDKMKHSAITKIQHLKEAYPLKIRASDIKKFSTLAQFDEHITAPLHGFKSALDYYTQASAMQFLRHIKVPTLILHAADDPFMAPDVVPHSQDLSPTIRYELSQAGGHVGFLAGTNPFKPIFWLEKRVPAYLQEQLHLMKNTL